MSEEVSPVQKKRRLIIDRITYLKSLKWNDFIKQWVSDLYDELEAIDKSLTAKKIIIEDTIDEECVSVEDNGCAKIVDLTDGGHDGVFIKLQSWNEETREHHEFDQFIGRKVRATIEVIPS